MSCEEHPISTALPQLPPRTAMRRTLRDLVDLKLDVLDFLIALARKVGGFCALLTLGWTYFRLLALGNTVRDLYPSAPDPDLRQTLWVALLLIAAQGWDISTDQIASYWHRLRRRWPAAPPTTRDDAAVAVAQIATSVRRPIEPIVVHLGRFMDLCVAIANKVGAFAVLVYLLYLGERTLVAGVTARQLYPSAEDPGASLLADLCVYVVVLGWWAIPFDQIAKHWRRLRQRPEA